MAVVGTAITVGLAGCSGDDENGDDGAGLSPTDGEPGVGGETDGPGEETETDDPLGEETETETETDDPLGEETETETDDPLGEETETETDDPLGEGTETETGTENGTETPLAGEERGENETGDDGQ